jgi:hypothetical protein
MTEVALVGQTMDNAMAIALAAWIDLVLVEANGCLSDKLAKDPAEPLVVGVGELFLELVMDLPQPYCSMGHLVRDYSDAQVRRSQSDKRADRIVSHVKAMTDPEHPIEIVLRVTIVALGISLRSST